MSGKLHIDISKGIIDVEGNEDLAKEIYQDFKGQLLDAVAKGRVQAPTGDDTAPAKRARKPQRRVKPEGSNSKPKSADYVPNLLTDLDLSGLPEFYNQFELSNNPQKILVFLKHLENAGLKPPYTADQVYSCYKRMKERPPKVFLQAFRDAAGRNYGYINYEGPEAITLSQLGQTYFDHDLKRKGSDE